MPHVRWICKPKFNGRLQEHVTNLLDDRCLLALPDVQILEQTSVAFSEIEHVVEDFVDEGFTRFWRVDNRWIRATQRADEELCKH
jgi:hypothetical protein